MAMDRLFQLMSEKKASDLFISVGAPINIKINGVAVPINQQIMDAQTVLNLLEEVVSREQFEEFQAEHELNMGVSVAGQGSYRISAYRQRGSTSIVVRFIPFEIPSFESLGLPPVLGDLVM